MKKLLLGMLFALSVSVSVYPKGVKKRFTTVNFLQDPQSFSIFLREMRALSFDDILDKDRLVGGKLTLLAPTNKAFDKFGRIGLLRSEKEGERSKDMVSFIANHIIKGRISRKDLMSRGRKRVRTFDGERMQLKQVKKRVLYTVETASGIIHVIDKVLIPKKLKKKLRIKK